MSVAWMTRRLQETMRPEEAKQPQKTNRLRKPNPASNSKRPRYTNRLRKGEAALKSSAARWTWRHMVSRGRATPLPGKNLPPQGTYIRRGVRVAGIDERPGLEVACTSASKKPADALMKRPILTGKHMSSRPRRTGPMAWQVWTPLTIITCNPARLSQVCNASARRPR